MRCFTTNVSRVSRVVFDAVAVAIVLFALFVVDALWLSPLVTALIVSESFVPGPRAWADAARPHFRLATAGVMLLIGVVGVSVFHDAWSPLHRLPHIRLALEEETTEADTVFVLRDDELHQLADSPRVDGVVSDGEFLTLADQHRPRRLFLLVEDYDLNRLPDHMQRRVQIRRAFRIGLERFFLVEILRTTALTTPASSRPAA